MEQSEREKSGALQHYLSQITSQIRCKKARPYVEEEISGHIEDQKNAYIQEEHMNPDEALAESIRQMGDPVSIGVDMDRIHRPKPDWKLMIFIGIFSLLGLIVQYSAGICFHPQLSAADAFLSSVPSLMLRQACYMLVGFIAMAAIYFTDYTHIGTYSRILWWILFTSLLGTAKLSPTVNGSYPYLKIYGYLFVPLYGGILYKSREKGLFSLLTCFLYALCPLLLFTYTIRSLRTSLSLAVIFLTLSIIAVAKGWFSLNRRRTLAVMTIGPLLCSVIWLFLAFRFGWLADYQKARILALFQMIYDPQGISYISTEIHKLMENWRMAGGSSENISGILPGVPYDYIITFLFTSWGIIPGIAVLTGYGFLLFRIFRTSLHQSNCLGMIVGLGCSLALADQILCYMAANFGYILLDPLSLPFLSYGFHTTVLTYILMGILLSIYRYKDVIPEQKLRKKQLKGC